jgi:hypothetical protein
MLGRCGHHLDIPITAPLTFGSNAAEKKWTFVNLFLPGPERPAPGSISAHDAKTKNNMKSA